MGVIEFVTAEMVSDLQMEVMSGTLAYCLKNYCPVGDVKQLN